MHVITQDGQLWRTLPDPARPAAPPPRCSPGRARASAGGDTVQRRVSCRGGIQVACQRIHVGMTHAGKIVTVVTENNTFRLIVDGDTVAVVPRTTSQEIDRYKAYATRRGKR